MCRPDGGLSPDARSLRADPRRVGRKPVEFGSAAETSLAAKAWCASPPLLAGCCQTARGGDVCRTSRQFERAARHGMDATSIRRHGLRRWLTSAMKRPLIVLPELGGRRCRRAGATAPMHLAVSAPAADRSNLFFVEHEQIALSCAMGRWARDIAR